MTNQMIGKLVLETIAVCKVAGDPDSIRSLFDSAISTYAADQQLEFLRIMVREMMVMNLSSRKAADMDMPWREESPTANGFRITSPNGSSSTKKGTPLDASHSSAKPSILGTVALPRVSDLLDDAASKGSGSDIPSHSSASSEDEPPTEDSFITEELWKQALSCDLAAGDRQQATAHKPKLFSTHKDFFEALIKDIGGSSWADMVDGLQLGEDDEDAKLGEGMDDAGDMEEEDDAEEEDEEKVLQTAIIDDEDLPRNDNRSDQILAAAAAFMARIMQRGDENLLLTEELVEELAIELSPWVMADEVQRLFGPLLGSPLTTDAPQEVLGVLFPLLDPLTNVDSGNVKEEEEEEEEFTGTVQATPAKRNTKATGEEEEMEPVPAWEMTRSPMDNLFRRGYGGLGQNNLRDVIDLLEISADLDQLGTEQEYEVNREQLEEQFIRFEDLPQPQPPSTNSNHRRREEKVRIPDLSAAVKQVRHNDSPSLELMSPAIKPSSRLSPARFGAPAPIASSASGNGGKRRYKALVPSFKAKFKKRPVQALPPPESRGEVASSILDFDVAMLNHNLADNDDNSSNNNSSNINKRGSTAQRATALLDELADDPEAGLHPSSHLPASSTVQSFPNRLTGSNSLNEMIRSSFQAHIAAYKQKHHPSSLNKTQNNAQMDEQLYDFADEASKDSGAGSSYDSEAYRRLSQQRHAQLMKEKVDRRRLYAAPAASSNLDDEEENEKEFEAGERIRLASPLKSPLQVKVKVTSRRRSDAEPHTNNANNNTGQPSHFKDAAKAAKGSRSGSSSKARPNSRPRGVSEPFLLPQPSKEPIKEAARRSSMDNKRLRDLATPKDIRRRSIDPVEAMKLVRSSSKSTNNNSGNDKRSSSISASLAAAMARGGPNAVNGNNRSVSRR